MSYDTDCNAIFCMDVLFVVMYVKHTELPVFIMCYRIETAISNDHSLPPGGHGDQWRASESTHEAWGQWRSILCARNRK